MGPAKVMFQKWEIIFVRHGAALISVLANGIIRNGEEFSEQEEEHRVDIRDGIFNEATSGEEKTEEMVNEETAHKTIEDIALDEGNAEVQEI